MPETSSPRRRRVVTVIASLALAVTGAAWAGCGDDEEEQAQEALNEALEGSEDIQEQAQQAIEEGQQAAEEASEDAQQALEDAQK